MKRKNEIEVISVEAARSSAMIPVAPKDPPELQRWLADKLGVHVPDRAVIAGHTGPLEYLAHVFFEGKYRRAGGASGAWAEVPEGERTSDCVVWANRGGGKTILGAVATLLDLMFKASVQVRVLAGSVEQSQRMHEHLRALLERPGVDAMLEAKITARSVRVNTGAAAQVLAASQPSVRGTRVQKLRCDEVDLFDPELWKAAQLVTRSMSPCVGPWGSHVRGSVEALSTMHRPHGLMWELVGRREGNGDVGLGTGKEGPVFRWGVVDVLERCEVKRVCAACSLWEECGGRAKEDSRVPGHIRIDDAVALKSRVDRATWESEMLCLRPRVTHAVYPEFEPGVHVIREGDVRLAQRRVTGWYGAMDFGVRSESVVLLVSIDESGVMVVERESAATSQPAVDQVDVLRGWIDAGYCGGGGGEIVFVAIDPAGFSRSDQTGVSNASVLKDAKWDVRGPSASVQTGLRLVRRRLARADGSAPTMFIHERCKRLIECVQRYHYPENDAGSIEPVKDGFDHACDALRYLVAAVDRGAGVRTMLY